MTVKSHVFMLMKLKARFDCKCLLVLSSSDIVYMRKARLSMFFPVKTVPAVQPQFAEPQAPRLEPFS